MDPDELAGWIFDLQLEETGQIFVEVADLVEALGARGLATFRRRLDEADRSLPADDSYYDKYDEEAVNQRAAIAYVREHFLLAFEPDVEVLKAFYAENPLPGRDRSIAEALLAAAEPLKAVEYAKNRAFAHLRERAVRSGPDSGAAASLVHLLFAVGDVEQAWEAAREFGLDVRELPDIAWALAHQHPADAISIMLRAAEPTIDRRSDHAGFNRPPTC